MKQSTRPSVFVLLLLGVFIVAALWVMWLAFIMAPGPSETARYGTFGDAFGSLNALFAGLGIAGLLATLYKQHTDSLDAGKDHRETIAAQARIARIQGYTSLINLDSGLLRDLHEKRKSCLKIIWALEKATRTSIRGKLEMQGVVVENELEFILGGGISSNALGEAGAAFRKALDKSAPFMADAQGRVMGSGNSEAAKKNLTTAVDELKRLVGEEYNRDRERQEVTSSRVEAHRKLIASELESK